VLRPLQLVGAQQAIAIIEQGCSTNGCLRCAVSLAYAQFVDSVDGASPESARLYQRAYALNPQEPLAAAGLALHLHHFSTEAHRTVWPCLFFVCNDACL
jgi:hypothetical protein